MGQRSLDGSFGCRAASMKRSEQVRGRINVDGGRVTWITNGFQIELPKINESGWTVLDLHIGPVSLCPLILTVEGIWDGNWRKSRFVVEEDDRAWARELLLSWR